VPAGHLKPATAHRIATGSEPLSELTNYCPACRKPREPDKTATHVMCLAGSAMLQLAPAGALSMFCGVFCSTGHWLRAACMW
jgi:hypothetical protein